MPAGSLLRYALASRFVRRADISPRGRCMASVSISGLVVVGLAAGCRPPASVGPQTPVAEGQRAVPVAVAEPAPEPLPSAKHALELLPPDTLALFEVTAPARALVELGVPEVLTHGGVVSQGAGMMLDAETRSLIETPERLRDYGIDPAGSMGMALLDIRSGAFAGWVTLSDPQLALDTLEKRSGRRFEFRGSRAGQIAALGDEDDIVLRDGIMFFVHVDDETRAPYDYARQIADGDPRKGLRTEPRYVNAFAEPGEELARAYLAPASMLRSLRERSAFRNDPWGIENSERELERMRAAGASAADLRAFEEEIERMRSYQREAQEREDRELALANDVFSPIESVAVRMDAAAGRLSAVAKLRMSQPDAMLSQLLEPMGAPSAFLQASSVAPHGLVEGAFEPRIAYELVRRVAEADGEDWTKLEAEFQRETGLSLKSDVFDQLAGRAALGAFFSKGPDLASNTRVEEQMDIGFTFTVKDGARAQVVLDQLAAKAKNPRLVKDGRAKGYRAKLDDGRKLWFAVVGERVVVTSDAGFLARVRSGKVGGAMAALPRAEIRAPFEQTEPVARAFMDMTWPVLLDARPPYKRTLKDFESRFYYYRDLGPDRAKKVRWSAKLKKKKAALAKLYAKLNQIETKERVAETKRQLELVRKLGFVTMSGTKTAAGFEGRFEVLHGGKTFMSVLLDLADEMQAGAGSDPRAAELRQDVADLEYEIEQARYRELDVWIDAHPDASRPQFPIP